jgi:putative membrane-bound dehydrogenase-like protein
MTAVISCIALTALVAMQAAADDLKRELPRIAPRSPAESLASIQIAPGFRLRLVACEPDVADPVAACYDAAGRLYVAEMGDYPFEAGRPGGRVKRLEDRDGDGRYEFATTFLDGLGWPTSVLPSKGGIFVCAAPEILFARDTDGDGVADERRTVFSGFGTSNVQGLLNNLAWGPDGWIYGASGGNGGEIRNHARPDSPLVSIRGRDFRFKPDGSRFEAISGGGQFGHTFDDWGHRFVCNNSHHIRQVVLPASAIDRNPDYAAPAATIDIGAEGSAAPVYRISQPEPWRVVRTRQRAADPEFVRRLPPTELVATGFFTSATGITVYRGTAFPPEYRGNVFIGDVGGNLVHRKRLERSGASFIATRADEGKEFLASSDNWFRPVNFANTPRGTLLVLDMYRETIEHPDSIPDPIKMHLDLTSGRERGRIYEIIPVDFRPLPRFNLETATTAELVQLLDHPDAWWRESAQRLLFEQNDRDTVPMLRNVLASSTSLLGRMHAAWALHALGELRFSDLAGLVSAQDPRLREQAARLIGPSAARDEQAAKALEQLAGDQDRGVVFEAAIALGEIPGERPLASLARIARENGGDPWIRAAVLSGLQGRASRFADHLLATQFLGSPDGEEWLAELTRLVGAAESLEDVARFVTALGDAKLEPAPGLAAMIGISDGLSRRGRSLRDLETTQARGMLDHWRQEAERALAASGESPARIAAIGFLGLMSDEALHPALGALLDQRQPVRVQLAAIRAVGSRPGLEGTRQILESWPVLGPVSRNEAIEQLLARDERIPAVLDALEQRILLPADIPATRRTALIEHRDAEIRRRAARVLDATVAGSRSEVIARYREALQLKGQVANGRAVFERVCATCHAVQGKGHAVGPDIATVAHRSDEDLTAHILDPNREVAPAYIAYVVATHDGRTLSGIIAEESASSIRLKRAEGQSDIVPRSAIEEIRATGASIMPEGLEKDLSTQDLADLLRYIRTLEPGAAKR